MSEKISLILLPGLLCDATLWAHQVENLSDIADIWVADLTGHNCMADLAKSVLDAAPNRFAVAGLSLGGYVAQEIMRQAPQRVTHLAFLDTNARADLPEQSERRTALISLAQAGGLDKIATQMLPALLHADHVDTPHISAIFPRMAARVGEAGFVHQQNVIMNRKDGREDLGAVTCPTLVLYGEQDQLTPHEVHKEMVDLIDTNVTFVCVPHCGHLSPIEQPQAVTQALRAWLTGA